MSKIFCIMGKSSSGKDTLYKSLLKDEELRLKKIVLYTTRPVREGEQEGVEYHFVNHQRLKELRDSGRVIEERAYQTVHGEWNYFTVIDDQIDLENHNYLVIGTLVSFEKIRDYFGRETVYPVYVEVDDGVRLQRALNREKGQDTPKYTEMCRRFLADAEDFSNARLKQAGIEKYFVNDDLKNCFEEIKSYIIDLI